MKTIEEFKTELIKLFGEENEDLIRAVANSTVEFAQRWIPVSESSIPLNTELLVKNKEGRIATALYDDYTFWVDYKAIKSSEVTHWRKIELL